ncbi:hypothetical protein BGX33_008550 [Mortierella sp. NVP41]|nr:hypothetical protein BGX33_008550 [Mortierella sp. NVP41]
MLPSLSQDEREGEEDEKEPPIGPVVKELIDKGLIAHDPNDISFQLVNHIFVNLLEGSVQDNGISLKPYLKDVPPYSSSSSSLSTTTGDKPTTTTTTTTTITTMANDRSRFDKRPFRVYVSKDVGKLAFADGFRNIVIEKDLVQALAYDEDLVAAVLAHELAHAMQDHVQEKESLDIALTNVSFVIIGHCWPILSMLGPFATQLSHSWLLTTVQPLLMNISSQRSEREADLLSLELLARSGYDPISAARFQDILCTTQERPLLAKVPQSPNPSSTKREREVVEEQDRELKEYAEKQWWDSTHPSGAVRKEYLLRRMYAVRQQFWANEKVRGAPILRFRYRAILPKPSSASSSTSPQSPSSTPSLALLPLASSTDTNKE